MGWEMRMGLLKNASIRTEREIQGGESGFGVGGANEGIRIWRGMKLGRRDMVLEGP